MRKQDKFLIQHVGSRRWKSLNSSISEWKLDAKYWEDKDPDHTGSVRQWIKYANKLLTRKNLG